MAELLWNPQWVQKKEKQDVKTVKVKIEYTEPQKPTNHKDVVLLDMMRRYGYYEPDGELHGSNGLIDWSDFYTDEVDNGSKFGIEG